MVTPNGILYSKPDGEKIHSKLKKESSKLK